jgi:hypothetical protein
VRGGFSVGKTRSSDSDHSLREVIPLGHGMCGGKVRGGLCVEVRGGSAYDISLSQAGLGVWSLQERHESAGLRPCKGYEAMWV